ncbi:unnamed protein product [Ilex paraguariensis]|uniref:Uncharacterized protein n=1 Tax=Ilex paraguariensis TaxID=185542 RepID=A0ABC8TP41_9AQUA
MLGAEKVREHMLTSPESSELPEDVAESASLGLKEGNHGSLGLWSCLMMLVYVRERGELCLMTLGPGTQTNDPAPEFSGLDQPGGSII